LAKDRRVNCSANPVASTNQFLTEDVMKIILKSSAACK